MCREWLFECRSTAAGEMDEKVEAGVVAGVVAGVEAGVVAGDVDGCLNNHC